MADSAVKDALVAALDDWADCAKDKTRRAWALAFARGAAPHPWGDWLRDPPKWDNPRALLKLTKEAPLDGLSPQLLAAVGGMLGRDGIELLRAAQRRYPQDFWLNLTLADALTNWLYSYWEEAIGFYRAALAVRPNLSQIHQSLAQALLRTGRSQEAIVEYHKAIDLDAKDSTPHVFLSLALAELGEPAQALAECRKALELEPDAGRAHCGVAVTLMWLKRPEDAVKEFQKATELKPNDAWIRGEFGWALEHLRLWKEARAQFRIVNDLEPEGPWGYKGLARALSHDKVVYWTFGDSKYYPIELPAPEAIVAYRKCLELIPKVPTLDSHREEVTEELRECEWKLALDRKLNIVRERESQHSQPIDTLDQLALAELCAWRGRFSPSAAYYYAAAFTSNPKLAKDLKAGNRYRAACAAALACSRRGDRREGKDTVQLRSKALEWLRADLTDWRKHAVSNDPKEREEAVSPLRNWRRNADLSDTRDVGFLATLTSP